MRAAPRPEEAQQYPRETFVDVCVIGSGVSGLRAASEIKHVFKLGVVVLEARSIIGGRVQQDHTFLPGREVEVGAEFIHGDLNQPSELCEDFNWGRRQIFTWSHGDGGPSKRRAPDGGCGYYFLGNEGRILRFDDEDVEFKRCNKALQSLSEVDAETADKDPRTLRDFLLDQGVVEPFLSLADAGYCNTQGGTLDTVPVARACRFERAWEGDGTSYDPDFRMDPSYRVLTDYLAAGLDIRTSSVVTSVTIDEALMKETAASHAAANEAELSAAAEQCFSTNEAVDMDSTYLGLPKPKLPGRYAVTVRTADGQVVHAHRVVVTVPLPILRDGLIAFSPPLSEKKVKAAKSLQFANGVKVMLKFSRRPWPADCHGVVCADSLIPECWMNGTNHVGALVVGKADYTTWYDEPTEDEEEDESTATVSANASAASGTKPSGAPTALTVDSLPLSSAAANASSVAGDLISRSDREPGCLYICTGFAMGERADALAALPQTIVLARFLSQLDRMFGMNATGAFMEGFVHSWADEPFIHGAYSAVTSDAHTDAAKAMAEPHLEAVFFAGEATAGAIEAEKREQSVHFAPPIVLHGAMATGSAAACDVARSLGLPVVCEAADHTHQLEHNTPMHRPLAAGHGEVPPMALPQQHQHAHHHHHFLGEAEGASVGVTASKTLSVASDDSSDSPVSHASLEVSSSTAAASGLRRGALSCGHLRRLHIKAESTTASVMKSSRGKRQGYVTPIVPVSTWRSVNLDGGVAAVSPTHGAGAAQ